MTSVPTSLGWAAFVRLHLSPDPVAAAIRAHHLNGLMALSPWAMLANLANGILVWWALRGQVGAAVAGAWFSVLLLMVASGFWSSWRYRRARPARVSPRVVWRSAGMASALALLWGAVSMAVFPGAGIPEQVLIAALVPGMMAGGAIVMFPMPLAATAYVLLLMASSMLALTMSGVPHAGVIACLLLVYGGVVLQGALSSARRLAEGQLAEAEIARQGQLVQLMLRDFETQSADVMWETDAGGRLTRAGARLRALMRLPADDRGAPAVNLLGWMEQHADAAVPAQAAATALQRLRQVLGRDRPFRDIELPVNQGGRRRWWAISGRPLLDDSSGVPTGWRGVLTDITLEREAYARVDHLARFDSLTGLANRSQLRDRVRAAVDSAAMAPAALLVLDMDRFRRTNDQFGHGSGDHVLREAGQRLQGLVRSRDLVARAGGDEFAVLLEELPDRGDALRLGERIVQSLATGFTYQGAHIPGGVSVGIVLLPDHATSVDEALAHADLALAAAKAEGRNRCALFHVDLGERQRQRVALEDDLRLATRRGELRLYWQPQVDTGRWQINGCEALLRWQHPRLGLVPPLQFIPLAEESGLIIEIGAWVLQEACRVGAASLGELRVAVNVSLRQMVEEGFPDLVRQALAASGLPARRLELEFTESVFMDPSPRVLDHVAQLRQIGVRIALDDFGTGYSSFGYLMQYPVDTLKIDRLFVRTLATDRKARACVRAIMEVARALDMETLAEGVEEPAQYELLRRGGCESVQGFLIAKPMALPQVEEFLESWHLQREPLVGGATPDSIFGDLDSSAEPVLEVDPLLGGPAGGHLH